MKKTIITLTAIAALLSLTACGSGKAQEAVANSPRPTVTVTGPPEVVEVAPAICTTALTDADTAIVTAGEGFGILGDAMDAASKLDADGVKAANVKMDALNKQLAVALATYKTSRDTCKAAN